MNRSTVLDQRRSEYLQALDESLGRIVSQLRAMPEVEQVILFGSYAAGRRDLMTDLDLLVVMQSQQNFIQRTAALYQQIQTGVDVDMLVYTPEEFKRQREHGIVRQAVRTGKVVYEKERA